MKTFEISAPFPYTMFLVGTGGTGALLGLSLLRYLFNPGTAFDVWLRSYLPFFLLWLAFFPIIHIFRRQPRVWLEGGRLYSRFAPLRAIQSVPVATVVPSRLLRPTVLEYWLTGIKLPADTGAPAVVATSFFLRSQIRALAEAVENAQQNAPVA